MFRWTLRLFNFYRQFGMEGSGFGCQPSAYWTMVSSGTNEEYNKAVTLFNQKKSAGLKITPSKKGLGVVFRF